jgi:hypothetical protein
VQYESSLERDFIVILDVMCGTVKAFEEQPIEIAWTENGRQHRYTPDFLVHFNGGHFLRRASTRIPWLIEIKYRNDLKNKWGTLRSKFRAANAEAMRRGWAFHVLTEREIRTPLLSNAKQLRIYRKRDTDQTCAERLCAALKPQGTMCVRDLLNAIGASPAEQTTFVHEIWRLVAEGRFCADLEKPLSLQTQIWLRE